MVIEVPEIYKSSFDMSGDYCQKCLWYSPRASWKSSGLARLVYIYYFAFPDYDIGIGVASLSDVSDTVVAEFRSFLETNDLSVNNWIFKQREIRLRGCVNSIRVFALQGNDKSNVNVTKGKKLVRPLSLFVTDETQKLWHLEILLNAMSTFLRQMKSGHSKVVVAGNPDRKRKWFTEYYKSKIGGGRVVNNIKGATLAEQLEMSTKWITIRPTYLDIIGWINRALRDEIENLKLYDYINYAIIYLGDIEINGWDTVFHSFQKVEHYIDRDTLIKQEREQLHSIIIGVDDAERIDAFAASAITITTGGKMYVQESMYYSMKELQDKPSITERCNLLVKYLDYIAEHFAPYGDIPIYVSVDCAGGLYQQLLVLARTDNNFRRWRNVRIFSYTNKMDKELQLSIVNSAFADGTLKVVKVDKYSPQYTNEHLVEQIEDLRLMQNGKIDDKIPNDCTDALQYGVMTYLRNPFNLSLPKRKTLFDNFIRESIPMVSNIREDLRYRS